MTLRNNLLKLMHRRARTIMPRLGFRPASFTVIQRTWSGEPGDPAATYEDVELLITPAPKIVDTPSGETAMSVGEHETGTITVGPITPYYVGPPPGGYTEEQLNPTQVEDGYETIYRVEGERGGDYKLTRFGKARGGRSELGYLLTLTRSNRTP